MVKCITIYFDNFSFHCDDMHKSETGKTVWLSLNKENTTSIDNKIFKHNLRFESRFNGKATTQLYYTLKSQG